MSRVDVLIPVYNMAATLDASIDSIRRQTLADIRIIVVDDGSTDETPSLLADIAKRDARIVVATQSNGGIVSALNLGLSRCTAEFVARFDADDIAYPTRLERQLAYMEMHPECVAVGCAVEHMDEGGAPLHGLPQTGSPSDAIADKAPALEPYIVHPFLFARRAAIETVGGYRHVPNSEDSDLLWRLSEHGALVNLPDVLGCYRVHTASISSSIIGGRVMAVGSQLGALSALRRRAGAPDIVFKPDLARGLKAASALERMVEEASVLLNSDERQRLRIASAAKLMELARYRPFEIDLSDAAFIRGALALLATLSRENAKEVSWYVTVTAARLARKGRIREAIALTPPALAPVAAARYVASFAGATRRPSNAA